MQRHIQLTEPQIARIHVELPKEANWQHFELTPLPCYGALCREFIYAVSDQLSQLSDAPNARALGFFLRERAVNQAISLREQASLRSPRGLSFHLVPANVPMVAFHSAFAALLQGNPTVVRLSSRILDEQQVVLDCLNQLLAKPQWQGIANRLRMIRYTHDESITQCFSDACASRVIWGGDASIRAIRQCALPARAHEIAFADRQSCAIFDQTAIRAMPGRALAIQLEQLAQDIGQFAQASCSSPSLLVWLGEDTRLRQRIFTQLSQQLSGYFHQGCEQLGRLQQACIEGRMDHWQQQSGIGWGRWHVGRALSNVGAGVLYWTEQSSGEQWLTQPTDFQTCVVVGGSRDDWRTALQNAPLCHVDRVVAPGQALAFDWVWDGVDLLSALSRIQR